MSRLTYLAGVALVVVGVAFLLTDRLTWRPGVTEANVKRICEGMTLAEVEALLGGKPDRTYGPGHDFPRPMHRWLGQAGAAWVASREGIVEQFGWDPD